MCFDLNKEKYILFCKPNNTALYIYAQSNHPPIVKKHFPQMIGQKISNLSCNKEAFGIAAPEYNQALRRSVFKHTIMHKASQSSPNHSNNYKKKQNIIWVNPPFKKNVTTNIGKESFSLLSKHFPPTTNTTRSSINKMCS